MIVARLQKSPVGTIIEVQPQWVMTEEEKPIEDLLRQGWSMVAVENSKGGYVYYRTRTSR